MSIGVSWTELILCVCPSVCLPVCLSDCSTPLDFTPGVTRVSLQKNYSTRIDENRPLKPARFSLEVEFAGSRTTPGAP